MPLKHVGYVDLPPHRGSSGFDHAAVDGRTGRVFVAHTANDAVDVIDGRTRRYLGSIPKLPAVAGALVSEEHDLVFTSNRGEDTVGIFRPETEPDVVKIGVGIRPNGLAYDPERHRLLAANVGDPARRGSHTVTIVDVRVPTRITDVLVSGRTRWTVFDPAAKVFHVNIMDPPQIVVVDAGDPPVIKRVVPIPCVGPHGLDIDVATRQLFCACDGKELIEVDADSGAVLRRAALSGVPDVVFFNAALKTLYVAVGEPGVIDVFDTATLQRRDVVPTETGAHTLAFEAGSNTAYAFLPATHRAAVYVDGA
jgi:DNA-binding beta-propeller fold protein YncE